MTTTDYVVIFPFSHSYGTHYTSIALAQPDWQSTSSLYFSILFMCLALQLWSAGLSTLSHFLPFQQLLQVLNKYVHSYSVYEQMAYRLLTVCFVGKFAVEDVDD